MAGEIIVNTPRETTMQDIAAALKSIAFSQAAKQENISDWAQLSGLSRNGYLKELFDFGDQIHDRHYITSWFIRIKIYNWHHPESVQDFTVAAGKFCNVLQINVWMVYLDILI